MRGNGSRDCVPAGTTTAAIFPRQAIGHLSHKLQGRRRTSMTPCNHTDTKGSRRPSDLGHREPASACLPATRLVILLPTLFTDGTNDRLGNDHLVPDDRGSCKGPPPDCRRIVIRLRYGVKGRCGRRATSTGEMPGERTRESALDTSPPAHRPAAVSPMGGRGGDYGPQPRPEGAGRGCGAHGRERR
jgi:hypothetical protein